MFADYSGVANVCAATRESQVNYAVDVATGRRVTSIEESLSVALQEQDAKRCVLVRGRKPVFVLLCDAEELLHLLRSWRCRRPVRIEGPSELAEEAVEFLLAHGD